MDVLSGHSCIRDVKRKETRESDRLLNQRSKLRRRIHSFIDVSQLSRKKVRCLEHYYKLCLLGDAGVGKTTLIARYLTGSFNEHTQLTLGVQFHVKRLDLDGLPVMLQVWDFGGSGHFRFLVPAYLAGAKGAIFVYDITSPPSLSSLNTWMSLLQSSIRMVPVLLVGTKNDLAQDRKVSLREAKEMGKIYGITQVMEASAKTGENVEHVFDMIARMLVQGSSKIPPPLTPG